MDPPDIMLMKKELEESWLAAADNVEDMSP